MKILQNNRINIKELILLFFIISSLVLNIKIILLKKKDNFSLMKNYTKNNLNGFLKYSKLKNYKMKNPKISIIISVFNGEGQIKPVVRSIQNQDFLDLEIIIVDDFSKDKSIEIIKELMKEDPRIILLTNNENKGTLFTKTKGVLNAKGKYVITLDQDDVYSSKFTFSLLYDVAERNNLDLLGFSSINTSIDIKNLYKYQYHNYFETPIIYNTLIKDRILNLKPKEFENESETLLCLYLIKTKLFIKIINILGSKILNRNIDSGDDTILVFLLSRFANNLKHIKRILHLILIWPNKNPQIIFRNDIKFKFREKKKCFSFLTFIEVLLLFTDNNIEDKELASYFLKQLFLDNYCRKNKNISTEAINLCKLFLENKYIKKDIKNEIRSYINESIEKT